MAKPVILTGLRANQDLHIGNYLGALRPIVEMQDKYAADYQINLFVPDLHSFTTPIDHTRLQDQVSNNLKLFVATGLDLEQSDTFIYRQSYIPAHSELTWILDCFTYFGEMSRMTQFKEKSADILTMQSGENLTGQDGIPLAADINPRGKNISVGLFNYPVLMAADILLYSARYVPVGEDQQQHVEIARDIALRMNEKFKDIFPDGLLTPPLERQKQLEFLNEQQALRIRDLQRPEKKMSKSDESGKGVIFLGDDPESASQKVMAATTDSFSEVRYDMKERPGVSNLLQILALLSGRELDEVIKDYEGQEQYGPLKSTVAEVVKTFLKDFQSKLAVVDESKIAAKLKESETAMNEVAKQTLFKVQQAVGLRPL